MNQHISFLIPIYNEEKNIHRCIESLKKQSCQDFEVVFVDDGSSDNSFTLLQALAKQNPQMNIQVIQQPNQGAATTRLTAAKYAKHEFIMYHGCDDEVSSDMVQLFTPALNADPSIDAILPNLKIEHMGDDGQIYYEYFKDKYKKEKSELTGIECYLGVLTEWKIPNASCQRKAFFLAANDLYKKYNPLNENHINNDEIIGKLFWTFCHKVVKSDAIYYLKFNPKSTTKSVNKNFYKILRNERLAYEITKDLALDDELPEVLEHVSRSINFVMNKYVTNKAMLPNRQAWLDEFDHTLRFIKATPTFQSMPSKHKRRYLKRYAKVKLLKLSNRFA